MNKAEFDYGALRQRFIKAANPANAAPMKKYMKDRFEFLGIRSPLRNELLRKYFKQRKLPSGASWKVDIQRLWDEPYREFQYVAATLLPRLKKYYQSGDHDFIRNLITTKSWWDTVDDLAANTAGQYFMKFPGLMEEVTEEWSNDEDMWLNRAAILCQLKYKEETDEDLLYRNIRRHAGKDEFFMRKAIGWALRQYARTNPESVKRFVKKHRLSPLSYKEATKHIEAWPGKAGP